MSQQLEEFSENVRGHALMGAALAPKHARAEAPSAPEVAARSTLDDSSSRRSPITLPAPAADTRNRWKTALDRLTSRASEPEDAVLREVFAEPRITEILYLLNLRETRLRDQLVIDFYEREVSSEKIGPLRPLEVDDAGACKTASDRRLLGLLLGNSAEERARGKLDQRVRYSRSVIRPGMYALVLSELCATGRFSCEGGLPDVHPTEPLAFDGGAPFSFALRVRDVEGGWQLSGVLRREGRELAIEAPKLLLSSGLFVDGATIALVDPGEGLDFAFRLRRHGAVTVPFESKDELLLHLASMPNLPELELPPELHWSQARVKPRPRVAFAAEERASESKHVIARVAFDYGGHLVGVGARQRVVADESGRQLFRRDAWAEKKALERLAQAGVRPAEGEELAEGEVRLPAKELPDLIKALVEEGWHIEADGQPIRVAGALKSKVVSNIDWFDLEAELDFGGVVASLPELLLCARTGDRFVRLKDGSRGLAPDWLSRYAAVAQTGKLESGRLRFLPSQAGIINALLTSQASLGGEAQVDVKFDLLVKGLRQGVKASEVFEPVGFKGKLRDYQREGVAWMRSLETHHYGGCLADDMGLGKTVQVLAMLLGRHRPGGQRPATHAPSLIVVPKSLVFNWVNEAKKFTPDMQVLAYTGQSRVQHRADLTAYDLIVTTYGTLRQDILEFLNLRFNTLILDEAQAIKNPRSQAAKACRLIRSEHRLAISGTPIENGLDELWSIFEFLNPGMLGSLDDFATGGKDKDEGWLELLSAALRPFMLRRTKEQVLTELPGKTEKLLFVDLEPEDRRKYDELRDFYRASLTSRIGEVGFQRSKIQVLEALLRLRQASCHPGLIDKARVDESSSKLDVLFEMLDKVVRSGHKALIFSQFTGLLNIVQRRLEREEFKYEYLDGGTRDRQGTVTRFQNDPSIGVFLISLKAGGCGITLTASDYVFILDPWWNPAVEAQAIDRAHRMGQTRPVFAYRLIARDTVEEKIVQLQDEKRRLANAVISGERGLVKELTADDLERLFS